MVHPNHYGDRYNHLLLLLKFILVGYGDLYPRTSPGRALGFFVCIYGSCSISLIVLALQNSVDLKRQETKSKTTLDLLLLKKKLKKEAAFIVLYCFKLNYIKKHIKIYEWDQITENVRILKQHKVQFLKIKKLCCF